MKELFKGCLYSILLGVGVLIAIPVFFIGISLIWIHDPPNNAYYIEKLEFMAKDSLPSCKVIKKSYRETSYEIVVFKVDEDDYKKVLSKIRSSKRYISDPDIVFKSKTKRICRNKNIKKFTEKYYDDRGEMIYKLGFKWPDRIVLEITFR